jgi:hypothetical protein
MAQPLNNLVDKCRLHAIHFQKLYSHLFVAVLYGLAYKQFQQLTILNLIDTSKTNAIFDEVFSWPCRQFRFNQRLFHWQIAENAERLQGMSLL